MDTVTKARIDVAKNVSRWVVQKTAEATGDMAGNKFADKITSAGEWKEDDKTKKIEDIYISAEKTTTNKQQKKDDLRLFWH